MRTSADCIADCMYSCCRREAVRTYSADTEVHSDCILCCSDTVRTADCSDYTADSVRCRDTDRNRTATAERRCSDSDFDSADTAEHFSRICIVCRVLIVVAENIITVRCVAVLRLNILSLFFLCFGFGNGNCLFRVHIIVLYGPFGERLLRFQTHPYCCCQNCP